MCYQWNRLADVTLYIDGEEEKANGIQCHCTRAFVGYVRNLWGISQRKKYRFLPLQFGVYLTGGKKSKTPPATSLTGYPAPPHQERTWDQRPGRRPGTTDHGVPHPPPFPTKRQSENIPLPHPSECGWLKRKKTILLRMLRTLKSFLELSL